MVKGRQLVTNKQIGIPFMALFVMIMCAGLTGVVNKTLLSLGVVMCFIILFFYDKLYLGFPFIIFYNSMYGTELGLSLFRIYSLLIVVLFIFRVIGEIKIKFKAIIPLLVYLFYLVIVMFPIDVSIMISLMLEMLACFMVFSELSKRKGALKEFFQVYCILCFTSYITGIVEDNYIHNEYTYNRFMGTFEDPNYMGFFFTVAIFALIALKLFDKRVRLCMVIGLYVMLLLTLSQTAIVVNALIWMFYLVIMKKMKWWGPFIIIGIVTLLVALYNYGLENPKSPVIGAFAGRIEETLENLFAGNIGDATTSRTDLAQQHFEYFWDTSFINMMFGGIPVNSRYIHPDFKMAAHNEYVDMLLNIGVVGFILMLGYFFMNVARYMKEYWREKEDKYLFLIIGKMIWAAYAMTLTMFLDCRFMLIFLL